MNFRKVLMPLILVWMVLEIVIFSGFAEAYGFGSTFLAYLLPSFVGLFLLSQFKARGLGQLQSQWQQGQEPTTDLLHATAKILGSLFFLPPTLLTRILGFSLVVPGLRHMMVFLIKTYFLQKILRSGSTVFKAGSGAFGFYSSFGGGSAFGAGPARPNSQPLNEKDAQVIDINPIQVEHKTPDQK